VDSSTAPTSDREFDLDVSIVASGLMVSGIDSEDCTSDNCTGTADSAGTTC
jgi:hypothetical protein